MKSWKRCIPDIIAVLLFAAISFAYFFPADIEGKILYRHDASAGRGAGQELNEYREKTGKSPRWTNALFSGMPTYQMAPSYKSSKPLAAMSKAYHLWLPDYVWYLFAYMLGFYILLRAFDFRQTLAVLGSILWGFSSYFLIIIAAGHIWKVMALAYLPPMIAGIVLAYRGKYMWGLAVTSLFAAFEINANHVQMTYYYLFIILFMVIAWLVDAIRRRQVDRWIKATGVCLAAAAIAVCLNLPNLYHTWQYSQETMRGKSELTKEDSSNQTSSGLDRDYITQWSYGIGETWTLLVPNAKGGASVPLNRNETAMEHADSRFLDVYPQLSQYWGEQPGTSGPVYVGAFVVMLFILGLFIVKGPMKWALLAATILSVLLSWGKNFMPFTNLFIDHMPMYAKFRTVASILVIAEFTMPLLAMLALKTVVDDPQRMKGRMRWIYISFGVTAAACLLFALTPSVFFPDFISQNELHAMQGIPKEYLAPLLASLREMRQAMFTADCWRSLYIIVIGTACLLLYTSHKLKASHMAAAIAVLCLIDMWQIDKRYLNDGMFVSKSVKEAPQEMTKADEIILQDNASHGNFRVLNMSTNTFNENETSYFHKSIGGYHAAKLRRYQELIEAHITPEMNKMAGAIAHAGGDMTAVKGDSIFPVLNMLNMRYVIMPLKNGETVPLKNPYALGNAWYVDNMSYCSDANEEIASLGKADLRHEAVAEGKWKEILGESKVQTDGTVTLTSYAPDELTYEAKSKDGGVIVFSEIYYPGWTATIDGEPAKVGRADYVLRALNVPAGEHEIVLSFHPTSIAATESIAYAAYALLLLTAVLAVYGEIKKRKANEHDK